MAYRVRNTDTVAFGVMAAGVAASHCRFRLAAGDAQPVVTALSAVVNVAAGERLRLPQNMLAIKYNTGGLTDDHMEAAIKPYWENVSFEIDMMTDDSTVIADANYAQQATSAWTFDMPAND